MAIAISVGDIIVCIQQFLEHLQDAFLIGGKAAQQEVQEEWSIALDDFSRQSPVNFQYIFLIKLL